MPKLSRRHYPFLLLAILFFAAVTRLYNLATPKEYMFDEVYHAITAKLIHRNDPRAYEWWNLPVEPNTAVDWLHPPLAKYTQALGMAIFGENSFGWRISSVVFGVLVIAATAKLTYQLFGSKKVALFAAALASLDGLLLVQSRIAMNDIHVTFFILLTFICYLHFRYQPPKEGDKPKWLWLFLTGVSGGLAMGTKWSGIYIVAAVCLSELGCWFCHCVLEKVAAKKKNLHCSFSPVQLFLRASLLLLLPFVVYLLSYTHMFLQGKTLFCEGNHVQQGKCYCSQESSLWVKGLEKYGPSSEWMWKTFPRPYVKTSSSLPNYWENLEARGGCKRLISHFSELHNQILYYQTHLTATHPYQSRPYEWFLDLRPVWFYTKNTPTTSVNVYTFGNPILFWFGDVAAILTLGYTIARFAKVIASRKQPSPLEFHLLVLLLVYGMVWLPWQLSPRIMFFYHYTPAVPFLCIMLAYWLGRLERAKISIHRKKIKLAFAAYFLLTVVFGCFVLWYPNWTGMPIPLEFARTVYFSIKSWK